MLSLLILGIPCFAQGFDGQRYAPPMGSAGGLLVERAAVPVRLGWSAGLFLNIADDSVIVSNPRTDEIVSRPLDALMGVDLLASIGALDRLELALDVPVMPMYYGDPFSLAGQTLAAAPGLGDIRLLPKVMLAGTPYHGVGLGLAAPVTLPSGDETALRGAGEASIEPRLLLDLAGRRLAGYLNVGVRLRPGLDLLDPVGDELTFGAALAWSPVRELDLLVEGAGASDLTRRGPALTDLPLELLGGLVWRPNPEWTFTLGAGPGLTDGLGTPDVRGVAGLRYTARVRDNDGASNAGDDDDSGRSNDKDGDDIADKDDACVSVPEDDDGFQDRDGCPEDDNDNDGVLDDKDECPQVAEERGGDGDGCPDRAKVRLWPDRVEVEGKILFAIDSDRIDPRSGPLLDDIARLLKQHEEIDRLEIRGHTDSTGEEWYNQELSEKRAASVRAALVQRGVDPDRLKTRGFGERRPIAPNDTPAGRAQNRRVEFLIKE